MTLNTIKFKKSGFEGMPDNSVVLQFPDTTITIFKSKKHIYAEVLEKKRRVTYEGTLEDSEAEIKASVEKVMAKLNQIVTITKMNK
ncbi:MAG: hypothetical protein GOV00_03805 [Candidatus Altiarchaeota archaeon]|nr:hypothetical protein [Candidatus Altiarchaeota archaeon]